MRIDFIERAILDYVKSHHVYLSFKIYKRDSSINEGHQHNIFEKYCHQSPNVLSYSFRNHLDVLKERLHEFVRNSLDDLNQEHYLGIKDRVEEIFREIIDKGFLKSDHINFKELSEQELSDALEYFHVLVTDKKYVQLRDIEDPIITNRFHENTLNNEVFQELSDYSFLSARDFYNSGVIIDNHLRAIDMITNGNIPLYNGTLIDINETIDIHSINNHQGEIQNDIETSIQNDGTDIS